MNFQLRRKLSIIALIIVIIAAMWLLMKGVSSASKSTPSEKLSAPTQSDILNQAVDYVEKIEHFALQTFNAQQVLVQFIKAKYFYQFKNAPTLLIDPKVTTFDQQGQEKITLSSKRAHYLDNGKLKFMDKVDIASSDGITHKIQTQELLVDTDTGELSSQQQVTYLGEGAKIVAQGMYMKSRANKLKLLGDTSIDKGEGKKFLTKDLYVEQINHQKHYYSNQHTTYLTANNSIDAQGIDMNMQTNITQLLGWVKILQQSGATIRAKNLTLNHSKGAEIYHTKEKIHYQSSAADIQANRMHYDAVQQIIKLSGGVVGRYE